jgi:hypothetical protein
MRGLEVVLLQIDVRDDVVVAVGVLLGAEVPRLLLGIVFALLESLQFVVEVKDVVGLFVAEGPVAVLSKRVDHALLLRMLHPLLLGLILVDLGDGVVDGVVLLNEFVSHLHVRVRLALEVALLILDVAHVFAPLRITVREVGFARKFTDVCN